MMVMIMNMNNQTLKRKTREPDSPVYKLHCINKFGHPANSTLARILRLGGAKPEIVEAAKRIKCDSCDRARAPKDPPRVGLQDCQNQPHIVLSMVDYATSYHLLRHAQTEWEGGGNTVCRSLDRHVWGPQGIGLWSRERIPNGFWWVCLNNVALFPLSFRWKHTGMEGWLSVIDPLPRPLLGSSLILTRFWPRGFSMSVAGNHHGQKQLVKTVVSVLISGFLGMIIPFLVRFWIVPMTFPFMIMSRLEVHLLEKSTCEKRLGRLGLHGFNWAIPIWSAVLFGKTPTTKGKVLFLVRRFSPIICSMRVDPIRVGPITPNHGMALRLCFPTGFGYFAD